MKDWVEFSKSIFRPLMLGYWLVMRVLCVIHGVELPLTLSVPLDLAVLEYLSERIFKRWFGEK